MVASGDGASGHQRSDAGCVRVNREGGKGQVMNNRLTLRP